MQTLPRTLPLYLFAAMTVFFPLSLILAADTKNPELCNELFGLAKGTISMEADKKIMNPEICDAYAFLISRYTPGPRSSVGLSNPKVEGIVKLNPDFALALAKMLRAAPAMGIVSAYRTPEGQGSKNPQSNHIYGCAADLGYSQSSCTQSSCQWILANAPSYGIQIRMKYSPEWNHVEPIAKDACRNGGPGVGVPAASSPSSGIADFLRQALNPQAAPPTPGPASASSLPATPASPSESPSSASGESGAQICTPQFSCSSGVMYYHTSSCTQQPYQLCSNGCDGNTCALASLSASSPVSGTATSALPSPKKPSAIDQISVLAGGASSSSTPTSSPTFVVNVRAQDAVILQENEHAQIPSAELLSPYQLAPASQQTFTSGDLNANQPSPSYTPPQSSGLHAVLEGMKVTLLHALEYLKPFGGRSLGDEYYGSDYSE